MARVDYSLRIYVLCLMRHLTHCAKTFLDNYICRTQVVLQLLDFRCARDDAADGWLAQRPSNGKIGNSKDHSHHSIIRDIRDKSKALLKLIGSLEIAVNSTP